MESPSRLQIGATNVAEKVNLAWRLILAWHQRKEKNLPWIYEDKRKTCSSSKRERKERNKCNPCSKWAITLRYSHIMAVANGGWPTMQSRLRSLRRSSLTAKLVWVTTISYPWIEGLASCSPLYARRSRHMHLLIWSIWRSLRSWDRSCREMLQCQTSSRFLRSLILLRCSWMRSLDERTGKIWKWKTLSSVSASSWKLHGFWPTLLTMKSQHSGCSNKRAWLAALRTSWNQSLTTSLWSTSSCSCLAT